jgi:hypothetical protein
VKARAWKAIAIGAALASGSLAIVACRGDGPVGDPKTPANSPLPSMDRKDPDPTPTLGDAG